MRISDWSSDVCSSDLPPGRLCLSNLYGVRTFRPGCADRVGEADERLLGQLHFCFNRCWRVRLVVHSMGARTRSEEHTSELQSLMRISYAVFCLKKKNHNITRI